MFGLEKQHRRGGEDGVKRGRNHHRSGPRSFGTYPAGHLVDIVYQGPHGDLPHSPGVDRRRALGYFISEIKSKMEVAREKTSAPEETKSGQK